MFLHEEFKHLRVRPSNKLQYFPAKETKQTKAVHSSRKFQQGYIQYIGDIVDEFVCSFSIHGINRIFERKLNKFERLTWIVGFSVCFSVFVYVSFQVAYNYYTKPLQTVVSATRYPVFHIPFPEVTVCNRNRFNWQRYVTAKQYYLRPEHQINPKYENIFLEVLKALDTMTFENFHKFENLSKTARSLLQDLSYVDFDFVAKFMAWKCYEIFSNCEWVHETQNCCEIFFRRYSQMGPCLAFNTLESDMSRDKQKVDPFWPWRTKEGGFLNGLRVRVHIREQNHFPNSENRKGALVMLTEPKVWYSNQISVNTHTRTSISIKSTLLKYSNYTRIISPMMRKCLFQDELNSKYYKSLANRAYMYENCLSQCQLKLIRKFCNCTFNLFYPSGPYRSCKLMDYPCLYYHNDEFRGYKTIDGNQYGSSDTRKCVCLYNCESLTYAATVTTAYMNNLKSDFNNSYIDLEVFFQTEDIMVFYTIMVYTMMDLMASFGGLAALCIGCSLLSLMEITYFLIIDIPRKSLLYYKMKKRLRLHWKSRRVKDDIMENVLRN